MGAFLVVQAGIANVYHVDSFNLIDYGREAVLKFQGDFRGAIMYCHGFHDAGGTVKLASCNRAGDIARERWTSGLDDCPFRDEFRQAGHIPEEWEV